MHVSVALPKASAEEPPSDYPSSDLKPSAHCLTRILGVPGSEGGPLLRQKSAQPRPDETYMLPLEWRGSERSRFCGLSTMRRNRSPLGNPDQCLVRVRLRP